MKGSARNSIIVLVIAGLFFAGGGGDAARRMRTRWRAWLQPPTADQMQRALPDTGTPLQAALPPEAVRGKMWLAEPPRPVSVAVVLASIMASALLAMYFTGRSGSPTDSR